MGAVIAGNQMRLCSWYLLRFYDSEHTIHLICIDSLRLLIKSVTMYTV